MATMDDVSVGYGVESTPGTVVTPTVWPEFTEESLDWQPTYVESAGLAVGGRRLGRSARRNAVTYDGGGAVGFELWSKGMGKLLRAALAQPAPQAAPVARMLVWRGPSYMPVPPAAARTFAEFPADAAGPADKDAYWHNGAALYAQAAQERPAAWRFRASGQEWHYTDEDGVTQHITVLRFIESGALSTEWGIRIDRLTATRYDLIVCDYNLGQGTDGHHEIGGAIPVTQYPVIVIGKVASPVNIVGADEGGLHVDRRQR